jgi:hypothetical protein
MVSEKKDIQIEYPTAETIIFCQRIATGDKWWDFNSIILQN